MKTFIYYPKGTCSKQMRFEITDDNKLCDFQVVGGCNGNLQGIRQLILDMDINSIISKLDGIRCNSKSTSCPDQIAQALREFQKKEKE